jgi:hypothetical protein
MSLLDFLPPELKWELQRFCADPPKAIRYYIKCTGASECNDNFGYYSYMYHFPLEAKPRRGTWLWFWERQCECVLPKNYDEIATCQVFPFRH